MAYLERGEAKLHFQDGGEGPAVLLTHGFSATGDMWNPQRPAVEKVARLLTWGHARPRSHAVPVRAGAPLARSHGG